MNNVDLLLAWLMYTYLVKKRLSCISDELSIQKHPSWNIFYLRQYETLPVQTSHSSPPNTVAVQSASIFRGLSHTFTSSNKLQCKLHYKWPLTKATLFSSCTFQQGNGIANTGLLQTFVRSGNMSSLMRLS